MTIGNRSRARDIAFQTLFACHFSGRAHRDALADILALLVRADDDDRAIWKEILPEQQLIVEDLREWLRRDGRYPLEYDEEILGALYKVALEFPDKIDNTTLQALRRALDETGEKKAAPVMIVGGIRAVTRRAAAPSPAAPSPESKEKTARIRWAEEWVNMAMYAIADQRRRELEDARLEAQATLRLDRPFLDSLLAAAEEHRQSSDLLIEQFLQGWTIDRVQPTEMALLRLGIAEMLHHQDGTDAAVVINECVKLAKRYGDEGAGSFVNAILDAVRKKASKPARSNPPDKERAPRREKRPRSAKSA